MGSHLRSTKCLPFVCYRNSQWYCLFVCIFLLFLLFFFHISIFVIQSSKSEKKTTFKVKITYSLQIGLCVHAHRFCLKKVKFEECITSKYLTCWKFCISLFTLFACLFVFSPFHGEYWDYMQKCNCTVISSSQIWQKLILIIWYA